MKKNSVICSGCGKPITGKTHIRTEGVEFEGNSSVRLVNTETGRDLAWHYVGGQNYCNLNCMVRRIAEDLKKQ